MKKRSSKGTDKALLAVAAAAQQAQLHGSRSGSGPGTGSGPGNRSTRTSRQDVLAHLAAGGHILRGKHGRVGGGLVAVGLHLHAAGHAHQRLLWQGKAWVAE